jgi:predicted nucleic-acid-binding protein
VIGLDTNILVRYLTFDDPVQSPRAAGILERQLSEESPGFVGAVVLAELVWVLERQYRFRRAEIAAVIKGLLGADSLLIEHPRAAAAAVIAVVEANVDFTDAFIGAIAADSGCTHTLAFDRRASRLPGFSLA